MTVPAFWSLLYREPQLYDLVFPDADETLGAMVRTAIGRYLPSMPQSMLDIGCGTGRHLESFAGTIPECHGVDLLDSNITYARSLRAGITFQECVDDEKRPSMSMRGKRAHCLGELAVRERVRQDVALKRRRTWHIAGRADVEDYAEYRLLLPKEIQQLLESAGFRVLGMYDNRQFQPTDLMGAIDVGPDVAGTRGRKLYAFASKD